MAAPGQFRGWANVMSGKRRALCCGTRWGHWLRLKIRWVSQILADPLKILPLFPFPDPNGCPRSSQRLLAVAKPDRPADSPKPRLLPFAEAIRGNEEAGLPFNLQDYLDLLDTSGRAAHPRRRGLIPTATPKLLAALDLDTNNWLAAVCELPARFHLFVGAPHQLRAVAARNGWRWVHGHAAARRLYARANE